LPTTQKNKKSNNSWKVSYGKASKEKKDLLVVRFISPFMSGTVHQPGDIQRQRVPEHGGHKPGIFPRLAPVEHRNQGGHDEARDWHQKHVISAKR
jgi:hypothetical protein